LSREAIEAAAAHVLFKAKEGSSCKHKKLSRKVLEAAAMQLLTEG
jgi:hypothetical protein